ncbi:MAG: P-loop NTPase [Coriobacteriia bacterium]
MSNEPETPSAVEEPTSAEDCGGSCGSCGSASTCGSAKSVEELMAEKRLSDRISNIKHKVAVISGKGGVGKSTVAVNLAVSLMLAGKKVGLLDVDVHGPSVPTMLGMEDAAIGISEDGIHPAEMNGLKVMSIGFLLQSADDAIIWRGPAKFGAIRQFIGDVVWGELDYLIIDSPPGTGDEMLSVAHIIGKLDGAVVVTTPQKVSAVDVRKSVSFCRTLEIPVIGIVENMSGFACPHCGETTPILSMGGGKKIAEDMNVPYLGAIPIDPQVAVAGDAGQAFIHHYAETPTAQAMQPTIDAVLALDE